MENRVTFTITSADVESFKKDIDAIKAKYPGLITLPSGSNAGGIKLGDKTLPFALKVSSLMQSHPQYCPSYVNTVEFANDLQAANNLNDMVTAVDLLKNALSDTAMVAGGEAMEVALAYYNSVKEAARRNGGEAQTIYENLRGYFANRSAVKEPTKQE